MRGRPARGRGRRPAAATPLPGGHPSDLPTLRPGRGRVGERHWRRVLTARTRGLDRHRHGRRPAHRRGRRGGHQRHRYRWRRMGWRRGCLVAQLRLELAGDGIARRGWFGPGGIPRCDRASPPSLPWPPSPDPRRDRRTCRALARPRTMPGQRRPPATSTSSSDVTRSAPSLPASRPSVKKLRRLNLGLTGPSTHPGRLHAVGATALVPTSSRKASRAGETRILPASRARLQARHEQVGKF